MNGLDQEEIPLGVPGRIRVCAWCGKFYNNFVPYGEMTFCPTCGKGMLRKDCSHCGASIPFPPQWKCFACGEWLTIMPMVEVAPGQFAHSGDVVTEPDAAHRKNLEEKGNNWYDVVRGKAEGPDPQIPDVPRRLDGARRISHGSCGKRACLRKRTSNGSGVNIVSSNS